MKNFIYIVILLLLSNSSLGYAQKADKLLESGQVILDLDENEEEEKPFDFKNEVETMIEIGQYFDKNYDDEALQTEDLRDDLKKFYPNMKEAELYEREKLVRKAVTLYRQGKSYYEIVKERFLVPEEPTLVLDDDEYETGYKEEYIQAPDNMAAVVYDFKKVISYSSNPRDVKAIEAKRLREIEKKKSKNKLEQLFEMSSKLDWKKFFTFDSEYSPFTAEKGVGEWVEQDGVSVRLLSESSSINHQKNLKMGLAFYVKPNYFILASSLKNNSVLKVDFEKSENLEDLSIHYPATKILEIGGKKLQAYGGSFMLPFVLDVKNPEENLDLKANVAVTLCNLQIECQKKMLTPSLNLIAEDGRSSIVANYVTNTFHQLPSVEDKKLKLLSLNVEEDDDGKEILRAVLENDYALKHFDIFVENEENIALSNPRILIDGRKIVVRFSPENENEQLKGKEFVVFANVNDEHFIRTKQIASEVSLFDVLNLKLSLSLIFLAILGGFLLNFMPCVFPVLSLKMMSLTSFGARVPAKIRKSFLMTAVGILLSFLVLTLVLCLLKYLGYSLGWGIQFQNPLFLIFMMFMILLFMLYVLGIFQISLPSWAQKFLSSSIDEASFLPLATGVMVVLLSTPCTGPYLATTIGFAFSASYLDMFAILTAVSLGLALPYLFLAAFPYLTINLMPKPGAWMNKLNRIMLLLLFLTLVWLMLIYSAQVGFWAMFRLGIYLILFASVFYFYYVLQEQLTAQHLNKDESSRLRKRFSKIFGVVLLSVFAISVVDGIYHFEKHFNKNAEKQQMIDFEQIGTYVREGKIVIVSIEADWCLTCKYNELMVFKNISLKNVIQANDVEVINVDWTNYSEEILSFMEAYGRKGLPFYIVYSKKVPDGMVLPEVLSERELSRIIRNIH
ncbi:MAG: thioredoxin family protein [Alphaproteobacteria bacterium]|nr:thioredoxin family protein [Alphaproteobacteria bacterium]